MAGEKNLNFFHSINIICTKLIQSMGIYEYYQIMPAKESSIFKKLYT